ncbi:MAG: sec-independent translocase [Geodermatophilaceae bacterium]
MFSSIGWGEIMVLLIGALFIFGPDRLPSIAKDAADALKKVRTFVSGAREQIREEFGDEFADLDLGSLNPREFVRRQLLDDDPPPLIRRSNGVHTGARLDKPASRMAPGGSEPVTVPASQPLSLDKPPTPLSPAVSLPDAEPALPGAGSVGPAAPPVDAGSAGTPAAASATFDDAT